jgi:hypothetical protein
VPALGAHSSGCGYAGLVVSARLRIAPEIKAGFPNAML